jgi:hypothetical protein
MIHRIRVISVLYNLYTDMKTALGDGVSGLIITMFTAYSVLLKFSKVWERNNTNRKIRYEPIP